MIPEIRQRYHEGILVEAARRYGVTQEELQDRGGFESFVYEYQREGRAYILKVTHTIRRSMKYQLGELEWLNYLADRGVSASRCILSDAGNLIEVIEEDAGHAFLVMAYEKAPGELLHKQKELWGPDIFYKWGVVIGRMHKLTQGYVLRDPELKRHEWHEEDQLNLHKYLDAKQDTDLIAYGESLFARLHELPKDRASYGLCHTDLHQGNFHVDEAGQIVAFDFDDCQYSWFAYDIAVVLYYALRFKSDRYESREALTQDFMEHFMRGYREENQLEAKWFDHIHDFLRLRHLLLYVVMNQAADDMPEHVREGLPAHRKEVVEGRQLVAFDFSTVAV